MINIGLLLDILGAFGIIKGFFFKTAQDIIEEASTLWNGNPVVEYRLIVQKVDAIIGGILLSLGFGLQIIGNVLGRTDKVLINWFSVAVLVPLFFIFMWFIFKQLSIKVSNYVFVITQFNKLSKKEINTKVNNLSETELNNFTFKVLKKYFGTGWEPNQSLDIYKNNLRTLLEKPRKSTLGWWPLSSRFIAWCIERIFQIPKT